MKGDLCSVGQRGFHPSQRCEARQNDEQITLTHRIQYICYVYLLTFTINKSSMQVNVPSSHGSVMGHSQGTSCGDMAPRNLYSGYLSMVVHLQMIKHTVYIYTKVFHVEVLLVIFSHVSCYLCYLIIMYIIGCTVRSISSSMLGQIFFNVWPIPKISPEIPPYRDPCMLYSRYIWSMYMVNVNVGKYLVIIHLHG